MHTFSQPAFFAHLRPCCGVGRRLVAVIACVFVAVLASFAQSDTPDFDAYTPLENKNSLPQLAAEQVTDIYAQLTQNIDPSLPRAQRKSLEEFYLHSNYTVRELLHGGTVLQNDAFADYMRRVASGVLQHDADLLKRCRFYLVRSTAANAFATNDGSVFIYMGLLARLDNEAQLAFILSHELAHVKHRHALNLYIKADAIKRGAQSERLLRRSTADADNLQTNQYSQRLELQADSLGFAEFFAQTPYQLSAIEQTLDILQTAYLPFGNKPFEKLFFESADYQLPDNYELAYLRRVGSAVIANDDSLSTHPDLTRRRYNLRRQMAAADNTAHTALFGVSEPDFWAWRKVARFELPQLYLHNEDFQQTIYAAYLLMHEVPSSRYLKKCIAKALYGLSKFRNSADDETPAENATHNKVAGESAQLYYLLERLDSLETAILAIQYCQNLLHTYPNDSELRTLHRDLLMDFVVQHADNIEAKAAANASLYYLKTWQAWQQDTVFVAAYRQIIAEQDRLENRRTAQNQAAMRKKYDLERVNGARFGIQKIVLVNPYYLNLDDRHESRVQWAATALGSDRLFKMVTQNAQLAHIDATILTPFTESPARFNDMVALNEWLAEQLDYGNMDFGGYRNERISSLAQKYDTPYFVWVGQIDMRQRKDALGVASALGLGALMPPLLPYSLFYTAKADYNTIFYAVVYDTRTHNGRLLKYELIRNSDTNAAINAHLYDLFLQLKSKP